MGNSYEFSIDHILTNHILTDQLRNKNSLSILYR